MMAIQNFGFFLMYFQFYLWTPTVDSTGSTDACSDTRFWVGFFALDCFIESFCVLWMAMGGYTDSNCMFTFGWLLHLVVALPYCICTVGIPLALYAEEGQRCRQGMPLGMGKAVIGVYWTHCALFMVYVWMMLSITYYSFVKSTFVKKTTIDVA